MTFHFVSFHGLKNTRWSHIYTLCLKSCKKRAGADKIIVHYDQADDNLAWYEARDISDIEWCQVSPPTLIGDKIIELPEVSIDLYRLRILEEEGGFVSNLDFLFLRNFEKLRHAEAVIGIQCKQKKKLCNNLIGAVPGAEFIKEFKHQYEECIRTGPMNRLLKYSSSLAWDLSMMYNVVILDRKVLYPVAWSNKNFWSGSVPNIKHSFAVHLWESYYPDLTLETLKKSGLYSEVVRITNDATDQVPSVTRRSGILTFE